MRRTLPTKESLKKLEEIGYIGNGKKLTAADEKAFKEAFRKHHDRTQRSRKRAA